MPTKLSWKQRLSKALLRGRFTPSDKMAIGAWCNCMSSEFDYPENANYPKKEHTGWYPDIGENKGDAYNVDNPKNPYKKIISLGSSVTSHIHDDNIRGAIDSYYDMQDEAVRLGISRLDN